MILRSQSPWEKHPQPLATVVPEQCPARHDAKCFTCTASLSPHRRLLRLVPLSSHLTDLEPEAPEVKGLAQYAHLTGSRTTRLESRKPVGLEPHPDHSQPHASSGRSESGSSHQRSHFWDGLASGWSFFQDAFRMVWPQLLCFHLAMKERQRVSMSQRVGGKGQVYCPPLAPFSTCLPAASLWHHTCFFMTPLVAPSSHCFGNQECSTVGNQRLCFWCSVPLGSRPFEGQLNRLPPHPWMGRAPAMPPVGVDWGAPQGYWGVSALPTSPQSPPISPSVCLPPTPHSYLSVAFPSPSLFLSVF